MAGVLGIRDHYRDGQGWEPEHQLSKASGGRGACEGNKEGNLGRPEGCLGEVEPYGPEEMRFQQ